MNAVARSSKTARCLAVSLVSLVVTLLVVPRSVCGIGADAAFEAATEQEALARQVAHSVIEHPDRHFYSTGNARFDGQSAIAIYQMTLLGLGQIVLEDPQKRAEYLPAMRVAADRLVDPRTLRYAASAWGTHGVARMQPGAGHAYLGYINLGLGMLRAVDPETRHAKLHDQLSAELALRLDASPTGLIETYPGETWPPDVAAVAGSVGLHSAVTSTDRSELLSRWAKRFEDCAVHESGYLVQRVETGGCKPADAPRGSGTAVAAYFISFAVPELALRLHRGLRTDGERRLLGFSAIREYGSGYSGSGDGNAGPMVLGVSVGASGFAIGSARANRDRDLFVGLYRTATLFGVPAGTRHGESYLVGGVLGDALLLAMLTAGPRP